MFCYVILMSLMASYYLGDANDHSDCGMGESQREFLSYGASFILIVLSFILCFVVSIFSDSASLVYRTIFLELAWL